MLAFSRPEKITGDNFGLRRNDASNIRRNFRRRFDRARALSHNPRL
jgi:hypothetical protein